MVFFLLLVFDPQKYLGAQSPSLTLGNIGICEPGSILAPISGSNLSNIGAITLFIYYDSDQLKFISLENIDPQINGLRSNVLINPSRISIVWSSTDGADFFDNVLLNLKFDALLTSGIIRFAKDSCEIATAQVPPEVLNVQYNSGSYYNGNPTIMENPENLTALSQSDVFFKIKANDITRFLWQELKHNSNSWINLQDNITYSGTRTDILSILNVPVSFNNNLYRCSVSRENCVIFSKEARLTVDSLSWIGENSFRGMELRIAPNPFFKKAQFYFTVPEPGEVLIEIYSTAQKQIGSLVKGFYSTGQYISGQDLVYLPVGIFVCQYRLQTNNNSFWQRIKIVKMNN